MTTQEQQRINDVIEYLKAYCLPGQVRLEELELERRIMTHEDGTEWLAALAVKKLERLIEKKL